MNTLWIMLAGLVASVIYYIQNLVSKNKDLHLKIEMDKAANELDSLRKEAKDADNKADDAVSAYRKLRDKLLGKDQDRSK